MTRASLPVMALRGTPYERGHQHGAAFERDIVSALDRLAKAFSARALRTARRTAEASWRTMTALAPAIAAEIEGMADGAGCAVEDIFLIIGFEFFGEPSPTGLKAQKWRFIQNKKTFVTSLFICNFGKIIGLFQIIN